MATLNELIETLQEILDGYPELGNQPVNVGYQPNYPLAGIVDRVVVLGGQYEDDDDDEDSEPALWIAVSDNRDEPYAPREAWEHR